MCIVVLVGAALVGAMGAMPAAHAAAVDALFDARVPVADRSERARNEAFPAALAAVAVRVTGRADAAARLGAAAGNARRYVQRYGYTADGQLEVGFDGTAVTQLLEQQGLPVWGAERPSVAVVLPATLSASPEARQQIEQAALARGIPLVWVMERSETFDADKNRLRALAEAYKANAVLVGHGSGDASTASVLTWSFLLGDSSSAGQGTLADGVNLAADVCARLFAATGGPSQVVLEVSGVNDLDAYARTLNYLNSLAIVKTVLVAALARDVVRFELNVRGDAEIVRRTLALNPHLEANAAAGSIGLAFRYRP